MCFIGTKRKGFSTADVLYVPQPTLMYRSFSDYCKAHMPSQAEKVRVSRPPHTKFFVWDRPPLTLHLLASPLYYERHYTYWPESRTRKATVIRRRCWLVSTAWSRWKSYPFCSPYAVIWVAQKLYTLSPPEDLLDTLMLVVGCSIHHGMTKKGAVQDDLWGTLATATGRRSP